MLLGEQSRENLKRVYLILCLFNSTGFLSLMWLTQPLLSHWCSVITTLKTKISAMECMLNTMHCCTCMLLVWSMVESRLTTQQHLQLLKYKIFSLSNWQYNARYSLSAFTHSLPPLLSLRLSLLHLISHVHRHLTMQSKTTIQRKS